MSIRSFTLFRGILFDSAGNLWLAEADRILRFAPPFSEGMQPNLILGQPSLSETLPVEPRQNRLTQVQSIRFDRAGNLYVADNAASRVLVFRPPFSTFMNAAAVIGQKDFTSFRPAPFEQSGMTSVLDMAFDSTGALWVLHNETLVSVFRPPFSTGIQRDYWFDTFNPRPENPPFPFPFSTIYQRMAFGPANDLWFSGSTNNPNIQGYLARLEPPVIIPDGIRNAAGFERTALSPGLLLTLFGTQLGFPSGLAAPPGIDRLPLALGKTQVKVDGVAVPLLYAADRQITFLAPYQLSPGATARVQVAIDGFHGPPLTVPVTAASPGLFTLAGGTAAVLNHDNIIGPLRRGGFGITFGTGLGRVSPDVQTGAVGPASPLSEATEPVAVFLNGVACRTLFAGLAPGFAGLYQVNFEIPADLPRAASYQILLRQAGLLSNTAAVTVQ